MSLYNRDLIVKPYFKVDFFAAIFSVIAYGIVVVLAGNCFHLLLKKRDVYPNRMRIILPIYVMVMLLCSTWKIIGMMCLHIYNLTSKHMNHSLSQLFGVPIIVIVWGADRFMVRILIIFQEQRFTMKL